MFVSQFLRHIEGSFLKCQNILLFTVAEMKLGLRHAAHIIQFSCILVCVAVGRNFYQELDVNYFLSHETLLVNQEQKEYKTLSPSKIPSPPKASISA